MLKIRSTEKLATSNTDGKCDIERTILSYTDDYDNNGQKVSTRILIKSLLFQERTVEETITTGQTETSSGTTETITVTERRYVPMNNHSVREWAFTTEEINDIRTALGSQLDGKTEEEQRLIAFIAQTEQAGNDGNGWQGMNIWIPDTEEYRVVNTFD